MTVGEQFASELWLYDLASFSVSLLASAFLSRTFVSEGIVLVLGHILRRSIPSGYYLCHHLKQASTGGVLDITVSD